MILKRMDETIQTGFFDYNEESPFTRVVLIEPSLHPNEIMSEEKWSQLSEKDKEKKRPKVYWNVVGHQSHVRKTVLHYDDTSDVSNNNLSSYQKFFAAGCKFGDVPIYSGSSNIFSFGYPTVGGTAKAAFYLRYSAGMIEFIKTFDPECAMVLESEVPLLTRYFESDKTKKLSKNWISYDKKSIVSGDDWVLAVVCKGKKGYIVPFLKAGASEEDYEDLEDLGIDVEHSLKLMDFFTAPERKSKEVISELYQMGKGLGRNPFDKEVLDSDPVSEYLRLKGVIPLSGRDDLLKFINNVPVYTVNVAPNPKNSKLFFLPEGDLRFSELKAFIDAENNQKSMNYETRKSKKSTIVAEDLEMLQVHPADLLPVHAHSTVFMINVEGNSNKKKLIVQKVFPSVDLPYFTRLNEEFLNSKIQIFLLKYMSIALTGQESGDTPSIYKYWTDVFSSSLQKQFISGAQVYNLFQQFAKGQSTEKLIMDGKIKKVNKQNDESREGLHTNAKIYFEIVGKLLRLQHLIKIARENPEELRNEKLKEELEKIEHFEQYPTKGVFGIMAKEETSVESILGESAKLLRDYQRYKLESFILRASVGVPDRNFKCFVHGAMVGMLLDELCRTVTRAGRRFSATQGRQITRLRGKELIGIFCKGIDLLLNLECAQKFNCEMLPFIESMKEESRRDDFNNGLIIGMTFIDKKDDQKTEEVKND